MSKRTQKKPARLITLTADVNFEAAAANDGGEKQLPRFNMLAYTGGPMRVSGFYRPVIVDLAGMTTPKSLPILRDHDQGSVVGHVDTFELSESAVKAAGVISGASVAAAEVIASSKNGFPWQASIGADVTELESIGEKVSVKVNGKTFSGPVLVARKSALKEISFVAVGADGNTSARVAAQSNEKQEYDMDFAKWLEAKGFAIDTLTDIQKVSLEANWKAEQDAERAKATPAPEKKVEASADSTVVSPVEQMRLEAAAESARIGEVRKLAIGHPDIEAKAISEGWDATKTELTVLRASRPTAPSVGGQTTVKTPQVFEATALMANGMSGDRLLASYKPEVVEAADKLRGIGLQEMCELACGAQLPRFNRNPGEWLQAAFSTATLPGILSNVSNKMLLEGYNYIENTWREICKIASVNDFKQHTRYRMGADFKFNKVGADGELKHGSLSEQSFTNQADTHGIMFALTRQMIINDDLGAFTEIPMQIGIGAGEAIAEAVWTLLLSNPSSFFATGNGNYASGSDTALSIDSLTAAELLFLNQTKPNGRPLGISPAKLVVPNGLKVTAENLMNSLQVNETTTANKAKPVNNPHAGKFSVVPSSYLANSGITGYSATAWYLFADPNRLAAMEVAFLNGVDRPTVERADADFNTLGVQFRGYIDFGVKEQDYRGAVKIAGV